MSQESSCIFCRIVGGSESAHIVYQDSSAIAFFPLAPVSEGHTLVVPRVHARTLLDIDPASAGALMVAATNVARILQRALQPEGLTMFQTNEKAGWQSVFHVHLHLVPRWANDKLVQPWTVKSSEVGDLDSLRIRIAFHDVE
jgi:histidine triad (HIT) family protein